MKTFVQSSFHYLFLFTCLLSGAVVKAQQKKEVADYNATIICVPSVDVSAKNSFYIANKKPLVSNPLIQLPLGAIKPKDWLQTQIRLMSEGMTGHLDEISKYLDSTSGWLGGPDKGWEEAAYWLRGFYVLAQISEDSVRLRKIALQWIDAIIQSQQADGYYGSKYNRRIKDKKTGGELVDVWPQMPMNDALISHYEATKDKRILLMLTRFFGFCRNLPDSLFLRPLNWTDIDFYSEKPLYLTSFAPLVQNKRAGEFVPQLIWLYNHTGEQWMLDLAVKIYQKTMPEMNEWIDRHTVNFAQRFRYPAQMYPITGDVWYLHKSEMFYNSFVSVWGQMPRGAYAADERIRMGKLDPRQAIETCSMIELNKSHYVLSGITGNTTSVRPDQLTSGLVNQRTRNRRRCPWDGSSTTWYVPAGHLHEHLPMVISGTWSTQKPVVPLGAPDG